MEDKLRLVGKSCAVTAFDMKVEVSKDGRERGLWIFLRDRSQERAAAHKRWLSDPDFADLMGKLDEGALLEWDALEDVYNAIGKELKKHRRVK